MRKLLRPLATLMVVSAGSILPLVGCASSGPGTSPPPGSSIPAAPQTTVPSTTVPSTTTPSTSVPPPPPPPTLPVPAPTLKLGARGPDVLALQERLTTLGYWLGSPDGVFGDATQQAVYAIQKAASLPRDGVVGPATEAALAAGVVPTPRSPSGSLIEIDLERDLLLLVSDGKLRFVLNTSTGGGYRYTEDGVTAVANTPRGRFQVSRVVNGMVVGPLGDLWRPRFFVGGYAIHGSSSVPPWPASHGCVRVSNEAIDWIWADNLAPIGSTVWVY